MLGIFKTLVTCLLASLLFAAPAGALSKRCTPAGYSVVEADSHGAILRRKLKARDWEEGPFRTYACSSRFGRLVALGKTGISPDGAVWEDVRARNSRFVVSVTGWGGDDTSEDRGIFVHDLKSGKKVSGAAVTGQGIFNSGFGAVSLIEDGSIAWTSAGIGPGGQSVRQAWRLSPGGVAELVSSAPQMDLGFIRWAKDGAHVVWTDTPSSLDYAPQRPYDYEKLRGGRCVRTGDRLLGRGPGYVYLSRTFRADGWTNARVLIACSLRWKRRVGLSHSGTFNGERYRYELPKVNKGFAMSITRRINDGGDERVTVGLFDLGRDAIVCLADAASGLTEVRTSSIELDEAGSVAWIATGRDPEITGSRRKQLRICDGASTRTLVEDPGLDEQFLRLSEGKVFFDLSHSND